MDTEADVALWTVDQRINAQFGITYGQAEVGLRVDLDWRPIAEFDMRFDPKSTYRRKGLMLQLAGQGGNPPHICEGYAQHAMVGKRPNQRAELRFYDAAGRWTAHRAEYFMPLPEPRAP